MRSILVFSAVCAALCWTARAQQGSTYKPMNLTDLSATSGVQLKANITSLASSPSWVQVSYSGVSNPSIYDAVAFVVPATATYNETAPQKFFWATTNNSQYLSSGSGSVNFHILNHRAPFKFIFVTNVSDWLGNFTLLAQTPTIELADPNQPTQIHMSYTNTSGNIALQWTTTDQPAMPTVQYGTASGMYTFEANGTSTTYLASDLCGGTASHAGYIFPGWFSFVELSDLEANTRYFYIVGSPELGFSTENSFLTAPEIGSDETVNFIALADLSYCELDGAIEWSGWYYNNITVSPPGTVREIQSNVYNDINTNWDLHCSSLQTAQMMAKDMTDRTLVVHNGDLSYAMGFVYGWDVYMDMIAPVLSQAPYMMVNGNHEEDWAASNVGIYPNATDSGGECGVVTKKRFPMPKANNWYSFDYGPVHFVQFDTELDYSPGSAQWTFVTNDLRTVNRSITPWVIVGFHRPIYTISVDGDAFSSSVGTQQLLRDAYEVPFFQYQVDMTLFGHVHEYSRTCPVFQLNCMPNNPDGSNGAPVHVLIGHAGRSFSLENTPVIPEYYESAAIQHGYMRITANRTVMAVEVVDVNTGHLTDSWTFTKPANWAANATAAMATLGNFYGNYTPSDWEVHGINSAATAEVIGAAEALLLGEPEMLELLRNASYVLTANPFESMAGTNQIYGALMEIYETQIQGTPRETPQTKFFWTNYFLPLWTSYQSHPDGLLAGAELGPASFPDSQVSAQAANAETAG